MQGRQFEIFVQQNASLLSEEVCKLPTDNLTELERKIEKNEDNFKSKLVRKKKIIKGFNQFN